MKRLLALMFVCLVFAGSALATTSTVSKWNATALTGRLIATGSYTFNLVTLQADADTSITSDVIDLTGASRLPGRVIFTFTWAAAAGGSTTSSIQFRMYAHSISTATAGINSIIGTAGNALYLGSTYVVGAYPAIFTITSVASGTCGAYLTAGATVTPLATIPRYISFIYDKEGNGKFTAGTVTLSWETYAP